MRRLRIRNLIIIAVFALITVFFMQCNSERQEKGPTVVTVGAVIPMTGPGAALGEFIKRGLDLGVEDVNAKSTDLSIKILFEDSKTSPATGLTSFKKLVDIDKVNIVLVAFSAVCNSVAPAAEEKGVLMIGMTTSMPNLTNNRNFVIRMFPNVDMLAGTMADYALLHFSNLAIVYAEDEYGKNTYLSFKQKFENQERKVIFAESFSPTDVEFRSLVAKMYGKKPEAAYLPGYGPGYIALINQIREKLGNIAILGDSPLTNPSVYRAAGNAVEGVVVPATLLDAGIAQTEDQKKFLESYQKRFHENPSINVTINYDFVHILASALRLTDKSPKAVRNFFVQHSPHDGIVGKIQYKADGESIIPVRPMRISGGKIMELN